jgi:4-hydroxythreonine-4-phosphate dehydrogenase
MTKHLAVTMGDPAGIGPEVLAKSLCALGEATRHLVIFGSPALLEKTAEQLRLKCPSWTVLSTLENLDACEGLAIFDPSPLDLDTFIFGQASAAGGQASVLYFEHAVEACLSSRVAGVVTCPINKVAVQLAGYVGDIGHQEILARLTHAPLTATLLMTTGLKVVHLSTHLSLGDAVRFVKKDILIEKSRLALDSLRAWGYVSPSLAIAALNPHGGEGGLIGREEVDEIRPAVEYLVSECREDVRGPFPADTVFNRAIASEFDAVLALYHDQGHIPIKVKDFERSVTATLGIPFVRTSVDHGTAYDLVGQGIADATSLQEALRVAQLMLEARLPEF